jgi:hypothetical protein
VASIYCYGACRHTSASRQSATAHKYSAGDYIVYYDRMADTGSISIHPGTLVVNGTSKCYGKQAGYFLGAFRYFLNPRVVKPEI